MTERDTMTPQLEGQKVLIVEDQILIGLDMEEMVLALGADKCWLAANASEAMALLEQVQPSLGLVDFHLGKENAVPVADMLMAIGIPFAFVTGYGDNLVVPERLSAIPILNKPVSQEALSMKLASAQAAAGIVATTQAAPAAPAQAEAEGIDGDTIDDASGLPGLPA